MNQYQLAKETCWTVLRIDVASSSDATTVLQDCFSYCQQFEQRYSRFIPGNWLDQLNRNKQAECDEEWLAMIRYALQAANETNGIFDFTIISALEARWYDQAYSMQQSERWPMGYQNVELVDHTVKLHGNVKIEFGWIGKGWLLDVMAKKCAELESFVIDFGWDIFAKWGHEIGLENPFDLSEIIGTIHVDGFAVAASNGAKRTFKNFHHLLDPVTWNPVRDVAGVFIAASTWLVADTRSTAVFAAGAQRGKQFLQERDDITGMIVYPDGSFWMKEGYPGELYWT